MNKIRKNIKYANLTTTGRANFPLDEFQSGAVLVVPATIRHIYEMADYLFVDNAQRDQSGASKYANRFFATMLNVCSYVNKGNTSRIRASLAPFNLTKSVMSSVQPVKIGNMSFSLTATKAADNCIEGGSLTVFTFTLDRSDDKYKIFNNKDSAHRVRYIIDIIEDRLPIPRRIDASFRHTNEFLEKFWAMQDDAFQLPDGAKEKKANKLYFSDLPVDVQEAFLSSPVFIQIFDPKEGDEAFIREIFSIKNDQKNVSGNEKMNNVYTEIAQIYDQINALVAIVSGDKKLSARYADLMVTVENAISEEHLSYIKEMLYGTSVKSLIGVFSRAIAFRQKSSASASAWTQTKYDDIVASVLDKNYELSEVESLRLLKSTCRLLYNAGNMLKDKSGCHQEFRGFLGKLNGCMQAYLTKEFELRSLGYGDEEIAEYCISNRGNYERRLTAKETSDSNFAKTLCSTPHSYDNALHISDCILGVA